MSYFSVTKRNDPSGVLCSVPSCNSSRRSNPKRKFFKFPTSNKFLFDLWLKKVAIENINLPKVLLICERHFSADAIGKKKLLNSAVPKYYLKHPDFKYEIPNSECNNLISTSNTISFPVEGYINHNNSATSSCNNSVTNLLDQLNRLVEMVKYYKQQINVLKTEIKTYQENKSTIMQIDTMTNLSSTAKEFGKMILNDSTKEWPCKECLNTINIALKFKKNGNDLDVAKLKSDNTIVIDDSNLDTNTELVTTVKIEDSLDIVDSESMVLDIDADDQKSIGQCDLPPITETYDCLKCEGIKFTYKELLYHTRNHLDINLYECERCGKEFRFGSRYRAHARIHMSKVRFKCKVCSKSFKRKANLNQHILIHKSEKKSSVSAL